MKKFILFIVIAILAVVIGFFIGTVVLFPKEKSNNIDNTINMNTGKIEKNDKKYSQNIVDIQTNAYKEKISLNTNITQITYYNNCNHQIENTIKDVKKYVNMTEDRFQQEFPGWEIKEFNKDRVILYKVEDDFCNEHFLVKDEDGFVTIYTVNNEEQILELLNKTDINTKYLAKTDQENLKKGMIIYTKQNLNKIIEDYE